jgi:hypothetical protein
VVVYLETDTQRRAYARIEDMLLLFWRRMAAEEHAHVADFFAKSNRFPPQPEEDLRRLLTVLPASHELLQLRQKQPDLAFVLEQVDAKLNLLLRLLHPLLVEQPQVLTRVTLSGGGVAFWEKDPALEVGDFLEMHVTLVVDAMATVGFFARVVRVDAVDAAGFTKVACHFDPVLDAQRDQIIQHVFKRQTDILRAQRDA